MVAIQLFSSSFHFSSSSYTKLNFTKTCPLLFMQIPKCLLVCKSILNNYLLLLWWYSIKYTIRILYLGVMHYFTFKFVFTNTSKLAVALIQKLLCFLTIRSIFGLIYVQYSKLNKYFKFYFILSVLIKVFSIFK